MDHLLDVRQAPLILLALTLAACAPSPVPVVDDDDTTDALDDDDVLDDDDEAPGDDDSVVSEDDDDTGSSEDDDDTGSSEDDDDSTPQPDDDDVTPPPHALSEVVLHINLGDSLAAGYNASGNNSTGGRGYGRLIQSNHGEYPAYAADHLEAVAGSVSFHDLGDSGATSDEILDNLESALDGALPASVSGDVLLTISAGGNDFNDSVWTMVTPVLTEAAAAAVRANIGQMITAVRDRYEEPALGHDVFVVVLNIQDPTDGTLSIPDEFDDGFCELLQHPALVAVGGLVLDNLGIMNDAIAAEAAAQGALLGDYHAAFTGHGMNATGADRWMSDDCAHPNDEGHHQLRREIWGQLTGDWL